MNKKNRLFFKRISEDRVGIFLSSLLLCLALTLTACGNEDILFINTEGYTDEGEIINETKEADAYIDESIEKDSCENVGKTMCVYVCGAVNNEVVYTFNEEKRVFDAIEAAGGFADNACRSAINMSTKLTDEQRIYVPSIEEIRGDSWGQEYTSLQQDNKVNINTADIARLVTLKGIGETRAMAIIEYREKNGGFEKIEDIMNVSGIGESSFGKIKEDICVR